MYALTARRGFAIGSHSKSACGAMHHTPLTVLEALFLRREIYLVAGLGYSEFATTSECHPYVEGSERT